MKQVDAKPASGSLHTVIPCEASISLAPSNRNVVKVKRLEYPGKNQPDYEDKEDECND